MTAPARAADSPVPGHYPAAGQPNGQEAQNASGPRRTKETDGGGRRAHDTELKDYQLGDCLGKGAFGSVYRALNMNTAETVAVKQIKLADLPKSELRVITLEIDLLKNLDHANIVKYHGFVKSSDSLNIILEYCENGSLHSISKNFGKFPENLVGLYMSQVLHGLVYLHEQGVIHRDIKGANILTTKQGLVKLADFGVATRTTTLNDSSVVGTPYWMAPEVIELSGATTASDIWSLGCTVIELLDGKPPYHKLQPMHALFRIVNDDHPPIPDGASPVVRDFLMQCFQKDHNLRVSARKLLKHPWIVNARKADAVVPKKSTEYEEAVKSVQQWNEALKSPNSTLRKPIKPTPVSPNRNGAKRERPQLITPSRSGLGMAKPRAVAEQFRSPDGQADNNWDDDFASEIDPGALQLPHLRPQDQFGGLLSAEKLKSFASFETVTENINWENDSTEKNRAASNQDPLKTVRPYVPAKEGSKEAKGNSQIKSPKHRSSQSIQQRRPLQQIKESPKPANIIESRPTLQYREDSVEDYSDLVLANDGAFDTKLTLSRQKNDMMSPRLFHPSDLTGTPRSMHSQQANGSFRSTRKRRSSIRRTQSEVEIQRYAENEHDEDFSCLLEQHGKTDKQDSDKGSEPGTLMLNSKLSNKSWLGDEDDEDDPFALLEEEFDETDLEANVARDKYARLCTQVEGLVGSLKVEQADDTLADLSEDLLEVLCDTPETKGVIVSAHGMLPILEILESCRRANVIYNLLKTVNIMIYNDVELQENLCFVGGIPIITQYTSKKYSSDIRVEAAAFVRQMCQTSLLTLQMFVSAGGLKVLVEFLEEDYEDERELVLIGVNGVWNVFELTGPLKNEFCRILSRSQVLVPLSLVLSRVLDERGEIAELCESRIANIFLLFSQAENHVKELVAERAVLHRKLV
jgi:serine/threonine protein kinase